MQTKHEYQSPYIAARHEWDERYGEFVARARNWQIIAVVCAVAAVIAATGLVALSLQKRIVVYPVLIDSLGHTLAAGVADSVTAEPMKRSVMAGWVESLRTVTTDGTEQRKMIDRVYAQIPQASAAEKVVSEFYRTAPPQDHARTETVSVDVNSVIEISPATFEVDWTETTRDLYGAAKGAERWKGVFSTAVNPPKEERIARLNPLGIYITQAHWSKVI